MIAKTGKLMTKTEQ